MSERVRVKINGSLVEMNAGASIAAAILAAGESAIRRSVRGEPRGPLCGMGVCFECRATVDGIPQRRTCQTACREGMEVSTDG